MPGVRAEDDGSEGRTDSQRCREGQHSPVSAACMPRRWSRLHAAVLQHAINLRHLVRGPDDVTWKHRQKGVGVTRVGSGSGRETRNLSGEW